jgi:hypothetical protein
MVALGRDSTILNVVDGITSIGINKPLEGDHVNFEGILEADNKEDADWMQFYTAFGLKGLFPVANIDAIFSLDKILTHPWTTMQFFELLLANF